MHENVTFYHEEYTNVLMYKCLHVYRIYKPGIRGFLQKAVLIKNFFETNFAETNDSDTYIYYKTFRYNHNFIELEKHGNVTAWKHSLINIIISLSFCFSKIKSEKRFAICAYSE